MSARVDLAPDLIRLTAPNPSQMTLHGTNTYILGQGAARVLIDPGPKDAAHVAAILDTLNGAPLSHILITHGHLDHSGATKDLLAHCPAPVYAFGAITDGQRAIMKEIELGGGEGIDPAFHFDHRLLDGQTLQTSAGPITAHHTPGHISHHLCFEWQGQLFTGDHVMGWATSLISPPDGDARAFRDSCETLQDLTVTRYYPGHGDPVDSPKERLTELLTHRATRETQILSALTHSPQSLPEITHAVYGQLSPKLLPYASRNALAHLIDLYERGQVSATPSLSLTAHFARPERA